MSQERLTDEQLIRNFQNEDQSAYDEIVARYSRPLFNFIYRIIGEASFAEDLLQETFLRLYLNKNSYREIAKFSTWIYTIAGNLAKTELRRQKVRRWFSLSGSKDSDHPTLEVADKRADPADDMQTTSALQRIDEEIQKLPVVFKEAVVLRDIRELSYEEISTILKIPLGTVKSRVNRGRQRLKKRLTDLL